MDVVDHELISLKQSSEFSERWVQDILAGDPGILNLGSLRLIDKERIQPRAGRLDLLLQDDEAGKRYEVEIQLGKVDESHIIRAIEYWDIERKRYPQYDHCAVIIAEDITSRFLNVINLLNGHIPIIAMQMSLIRIGSQASLVFNKVLDEVSLGLPDEDQEDVQVDREYWKGKSSDDTLIVVDELLKVLQSNDPELEFKYTKTRITPALASVSRNFLICWPKKKWLRVVIKTKRSDENDEALEESGLTFDYSARRGRYRINLTQVALRENLALIDKLIKESYEGLIS